MTTEMSIAIHESWKEVLESEFQQPYFSNLTEQVRLAYIEHKGSVFPKGSQIFRAFDLCPFDQLKVVILGQDPYPTKGHAHGLCFSVEPEVKPFPKSLLNIFKELKADLGIPMPPNGDLSRWAAQGVFLLNATLTVRANSAGSHQNQGWESVTDAVIQTISREREGVVFLLSK